MSSFSPELSNINLTKAEQNALTHLYAEDGAWTRQESINYLGEDRYREFLRVKILGGQDTDMGVMYHLLAAGRRLIFNTTGQAASLQTQLDTAYLRRCIAELGWSFSDPATPFHRNLISHFPKARMREAETAYGRVLLGGKITGGGYSPDNIARIGQQMKSSALAHNFLVVLLTPNQRKGKSRSQKYESFIKLVQHTPQSIGSRFHYIPQNSPAATQEKGPVITPYQAELMRQKGVNELEISTLLKPLEERIAQAKQDLQIDGAISQWQLYRYYGLKTEDMGGTLRTRAIIRPGKNSWELEIIQSILIASVKMRKLDDSDLSHRLITTQTRHQLGVPADKNHWKVETRNTLGMEDPDAVWIREDGTKVAIEADTGNYQFPLVVRKLSAFRDQGYSKTYWSMISPQRIRNLNQKLDSDLLPDFLMARWWEDDTANPLDEENTEQ